MFAEERRAEILSLLNKNDKISVEDLVKRFDVSSTTIRNDLNVLEDENKLKRTHGGAIPPLKTSQYKTFDEKKIVNLDKKATLAVKAKNFVEESDTLAIDSGTTTYEFCKEILDIKNLSIITNDFAIADLFSRQSDASVIFVGGSINKDLNSTVGALAIDFIKNIKVDKVFMACESFDPDYGFSTPQETQANWKSNFMKIGKQKFMLIDNSKFKSTSTFRFAKANDFDFIITDEIEEEFEDLENIDIKII